MNKDLLDDLFEGLDGSFDIAKTPEGHQKRFMDRLNAVTPEQKPRKWWKPLSIAASVLIMITAGFFFQQDSETSNELASISPELEKTEDFFINTINSELETLKSFDDFDSEKLVTDALKSLEILEIEYGKLKFDLQKSGNDQRVIAAMIENFQNRIDLLQQVIEKIEEVKTLKAQQNESTI